MAKTGKRTTKQTRLPVGGRKRPPRKAARIDGKNPRAATIGILGERLAADYLERQGLEIIERNWRAPETRNEIDLIARDGDCLVFIEVKTARTLKIGDPMTWVPPRKQRAIIRAAKAFIAAHHPAESEFRFDVVVLAPPPPGAEDRQGLRHLPAAFTLDDADRS